jgi:hypothetical protein
MTNEEMKALKELVYYVLNTEEDSYQEYLQEHGFGIGHIYDYAMTLDNFINREDKHG